MTTTTEIKDLRAENGRLAERVAMLEERLLPFARAYANIRRPEGKRVDVTMPTKYFEAAAKALEP